jgi:hypothetical protein
VFKPSVGSNVNIPLDTAIALKPVGVTVSAKLFREFDDVSLITYVTA